MERRKNIPAEVIRLDCDLALSFLLKIIDIDNDLLGTNYFVREQFMRPVSKGIAVKSRAYVNNDASVSADEQFICVRPTLSEAQNWLREKYGVYVTVTSNSQESWQYHVCIPGKYKLGEFCVEDFATYKEALTEGITAAVWYIIDSQRLDVFFTRIAREKRDESNAGNGEIPEMKIEITQEAQTMPEMLRSNLAKPQDFEGMEEVNRQKAYEGAVEPQEDGEAEPQEEIPRKKRFTTKGMTDAQKEEKYGEVLNLLRRGMKMTDVLRWANRKGIDVTYGVLRNLRKWVNDRDAKTVSEVDIKIPGGVNGEKPKRRRRRKTFEETIDERTKKLEERKERDAEKCGELSVDENVKYGAEGPLKHEKENQYDMTKH